MDQILLLTDFSSKSTNAHNYIFHLLSGRTCNFFILSVQKIWEYAMDDLMVADPFDDVRSALLSDNKDLVEKTIEDLEDRFKNENFTFECLVDYNDFSEAIQKAVNNNNIDLIVTGTDGKSNISEIVLGSHTMRLTRNVECDLLAIPVSCNYKPPHSLQYLILSKTDHLPFDHPIISFLLKAFTTRMDLVKLSNPSNQHTHTNIPFNIKVIHTEFQKKDISTFLDQSLKVNTIDMRVFRNYNESFMERFFGSPSLSQILNSTTIPLLILSKDAQE